MFRRTFIVAARSSSIPTTAKKGLDGIVGGSGESRIVVLGTGWAGYNLTRLLQDCDKEVRVVSPSNHFLFTPLLPSTAVGTLEFRCIQEPIRTVLGDNGAFVQAKARTIDTANKTIECESVYEKEKFTIRYEKLIIAVGVKTNTFGIESIKEGNGVYFLKHLYHARSIRNNIIDSFEKASVPGTTEEERRRLLSFIVVGGGPTSCEFVSELHDFVTNDIKRLFKDMVPYVSVTLVEAGPALLSTFDKQLQGYTQSLFENRNISVQLGCSVTGIEDYEEEFFRFPARRAVLSNGEKIPFGTFIWSAGLSPVKFTQRLDEDTFPKAPNGRLVVDEFLRVKGHEGSVWALGDAAQCETNPQPQLAQVALQQAKYLSKVFKGKQGMEEKKFEFFNLGSMASVGEMKGIYDGSHVGIKGEQEISVPKISGFVALLMWRFAYWGRQTSIQNKFLIPMHWFKSMVFGRDISRF